MCLALPGKLVNFSGEENLLSMGEVDFSGVKKKICLALTPEAKLGDFLICHVGFAISILNEKLAQEAINEICG